MTQIKLLPCPFCAGPPVLITRWTYDDCLPQHGPMPLPHEHGIHVTAFVFCHECGSEGPDSHDFDHSSICCEKEEVPGVERRAVENWNRRDTKNADLYAANEAEGRCVYPKKGK